MCYEPISQAKGHSGEAGRALTLNPMARASWLHMASPATRGGASVPIVRQALPLSSADIKHTGKHGY